MLSVLKAYGFDGKVVVTSYGNGLINQTWKLATDGKEFILQRVNDKVFKDPSNMAFNIRLIADHLKQNYPHYLFVAQLQTSLGDDLFYVEGEGCFRLFPFVAGTHSKNFVATPGQAYEAAAQFGKFTRLLSNFDAHQLKITIPDFHNLYLRYRQFLKALDQGNKERISQSKKLIDRLQDYAGIVADYNAMLQNPAFMVRVIHHDAKISNVLFNSKEKAVCVIDLDTVMPGHFISDVGDMIRTYIPPVSEEESDFDKIEIREAFFTAIVQGYYGEMKEELTREEKSNFFYAGKFMIYMQALRFLTDYLNNDTYYGANYEGHNFIRADNQAVLLQRFIEKEKMLTALALEAF